MWKWTQHSFAGGVQDVRLIGRQDIERYNISARTLDNFQVMRQGCLTKRRGTDCVAKFGAKILRIIPFVYERNQSYLLAFSKGESGLLVEVYDSAEDTVSQSFTATLTEEAIKNCRYVQTGDVVILVGEGMRPSRITRDGGGAFTFDTINFKNLGGADLPAAPDIKVEKGEDKDANGNERKGNERTVYYAATAVGTDGRESDLGNIVEMTHIAPWQNTFVVTISINISGNKPPEGVAYYNIYKKTSGDFGFIGTTKGQQDTRKVDGTDEDGNPTSKEETFYRLTDFQDDFITPDTSLTPPKREAFFESIPLAPTTVALVNQRLVFAATKTSPYTVWWSTVGDFFNFNDHESVRDDDGFSANIPATELPRINHIISTRDMLIFSDGAEWIAEPVSGEALTLKSLTFKQQSQVGASAVLPPTMIEDKVVFADATRETVHTIDYNLERDGYKTQNVTILSQSIFDGNPIKAWAYAQHPDSTLWCVLKDGTIATLAYMQEHELAAWSHQTLGGGMKVLDVVCTKEVRHGNSAVFILAEDTKGVHHLLRVRDDVEVTSLEDGLCLDNMRTVTPGEVTGLAEGEIAVDALDGSIRYKTMLAGRKYHVGYPFEAIYRSITPEAQGESTIQFELKDAISAELRLRNVCPFSVVPTAIEEDARQDVAVDERIAVTEGAVTLKQKDVTVELAGHANTSGAVTLKCDAPFPLQLLSVSINYELDPRTIGVN